ncbi:hypothetical protein JTE90_012009 [Oedothorax gibbosus]|uniref:THAP-type domain-containing protein n=1 Tax=Oedothorax gibbosus TaxID=931172 RepID=A0AAV6URF1_9ARAC|nr:hypothetical protein JTE90_012009 [Oedothorax gibbosus]
MTGCSAIGCTNRTEHGFSLKRFPSDPHRRKLWALKVKRKNWVPSINSYICEEHFDKDQFTDFEKKKLKKDAVPTLFNFTTVQRKKPACRPPPKIIKLKSTDCDVNKKDGISQSDGVSKTDDNVNTVDNASKTDDFVNKVDNASKADDNVNMVNNDCKTDDGDSKTDDVSKDLIIASLHKNLKECNKRIVQLQEKNFRLKVKLKRETHTSAGLRFQAKKLKEEKKISFFGDDQNAALKRKSMAYVKWSDETIEKALTLKAACGTKGYECILNLGFPFPSMRTLQRRLESNDPVQEDDESNNYLSSEHDDELDDHGTSEDDWDELNDHLALEHLDDNYNLH